MADEGKKWSPGWRKPSEVMKLRKTKRQRKSTSDIPVSFRQRLALCENSDGRAKAANLKRRNPFSVSSASSSTRRRVQSDIEKPAAGVNVADFQPVPAEAIDRGQEGSEVTKKASAKDVVNSINLLLDQSQDPEEPTSKDEEDQGNEPTAEERRYQHTCFPIDWSLRTRIRFTSPNNFSWSSPVRSAEEAAGMTAFSRCQFDDFEIKTVNSKKESIWRQQLQQGLMFWAFPNLPWIKLFPRIVPEPRVSKPSIFTRDESLQAALHTSWCESFQSAYHLLRNGHCPYFYLCTYQLTVLFRARHIGGIDKIHAMIGPTTRGLRESLKSEGIAFTVPLFKEDSSNLLDPHQVIGSGDQGLVKLSSKEAPTEVSAKCEEEEDSEEADEESSSWLVSMGFEKSSFPQLDPEKIKFKNDTILKWDNRPQSLVLVQGPDMQALYNFLLNYRNMVAGVGTQAGIPPTILSPVCFEGATLKSCKVKSGSMRQLVGNNLQDINTLEVNGPILPHSIHLLATLLQETQQGVFNTALMNHEPTTCFSCLVSTTEEIEDVEDLTKLGRKAGVPENLVTELYSRNLNVTAAVREVKCKHNSYEWT